MATKKYYWIKLKTDFFDLETIDWLMSQKNGCEYVVLYQKLCLLTANKGGKLVSTIGEIIMPYDANKIARDTKFPFDTVVVALELFKKIGLIYEEDNGILKIPYIDEIVGSESESAQRVRDFRARKAALQCNTDVTNNVTNVTLQCNTEIDKDLEKDIETDLDLDIDLDPANAEKMLKMYQKICKSLPKIKKCNKYDIKHANIIAKKFSDDDIKGVFEKAERNIFLKGQKKDNKMDWKANFHWIITPENFQKIFDGKYDNDEEEEDEYAKFYNMF
ncbi:MAG: phage replisome organizer N-terminal domain-containing protein [Oscillospiraceae bacterium]|nr:phage replisome organizer N-terminal domain-containing protein [Oscillospiraceae bacterium]